MSDQKKQIEDLARVICDGCTECKRIMCQEWYIAQKIYNAGYRKQIEGEWEELMHFSFDGGYSGSNYRCSNCHFDDCYEETPYCPRCGAKMKGGAE